MSARRAAGRGVRVSVRGLLGAVAMTLLLTGPRAEPARATFAIGDVFVSFEKGPVQWRTADGALNGLLVGSVPGPGEGMRFDRHGNLYVSHWCGDPACRTGNTVEVFDPRGMSLGTVGAGYDCNPHSVAFDVTGSLYVSQADCTGSILKFSGPDATTAYAVAPETRGSFWIELAPDGCTVLYTSWGPNVKRFDVCADRQLEDFNVAALPGGETQGLATLPDGGLLVSSGAVVARLNASGALVRTYGAPTGEPQYWTGVDVLGDGTFWAANYYTSNVYRFDLASGAVRGSFNTGTPAQTVVDVRVSRRGTHR